MYENFTVCKKKCKKNQGKSERNIKNQREKNKKEKEKENKIEKHEETNQKQCNIVKNETWRKPGKK